MRGTKIEVIEIDGNVGPAIWWQWIFRVRAWIFVLDSNVDCFWLMISGSD
jgi:hypothetical protein